MLVWSVQEPSRSWLFLLRRTRCSEQGEAVEPPVLLAPNTAAVASVEPQSRTTSSSALEAAAERPAPVDPSTGAVASALRVEQERDLQPPEIFLTVVPCPLFDLLVIYGLKLCLI